MKKKLGRILAVGTAALGAFALSVSPAAAGGVGESISGAQGTADFYYASKTVASDIYLTVTDTAPDGHHVRIRVQSLTPERVVTSYAWRSVTAGYQHSETWVTSLKDTRGIWALRIQVCVYEKDDQLGCGESDWDGNTYY